MEKQTGSWLVCTSIAWLQSVEKGAASAAASLIHPSASSSSVSVSAPSFIRLISQYLSQRSVGIPSLHLPGPPSSFHSSHFPIFNLSLLQWHHSCPPSPVIHSFLPPLLSISLCLFILGSFIIETWSAGLSLSLLSLSVSLC